MSTGPNDHHVLPHDPGGPEVRPDPDVVARVHTTAAELRDDLVGDDVATGPTPRRVAIVDEIDPAPPSYWFGDQYPLAARWGTRAARFLTAGTYQHHRDTAAAMVPLRTPEVAVLMAEWLDRLPSLRATARADVNRHGLALVGFLVPAALGRAGAARNGARAALRRLAAAHGDTPVVGAAGAHGEKAAGAVAAVLSTDPLEVLPSTLPPVGEWADVALLPQVALRDGATALPERLVSERRRCSPA